MCKMPWPPLIAVAQEVGIDDESIIRALEQFQGIGRRFQRHELVWDQRRVMMIDDYGHHPTELARTIEAVRSGWPTRRLVMVFQPHRYSRTQDLFDDFVRVLTEVDVLLVLEVYAAGEQPLAGADGRALCRSVRSRGKLDPVFVEDRAELEGVLESLLNEDDVLLMQGAGDIGGIAGSLAESRGGQV